MGVKYREEFTVYKNKEGEYFVLQDKDNSLEEVKLAVQRPNYEQQQEANIVYSKFVNKYLKEGILPLVKLNETLREQGVWSEEKDKQANDLVKKIAANQEKLKRGGIKQSEGLRIAKENIELNNKYIQTTLNMMNVLNNSAEKLAENDKFNYLVSTSTVYASTGNKVFKDYSEFLKQDSLGNPLPYIAGQYLNKLLNDNDEDYRANWPEYKFLKRFGYVNDKYQFVNKEGQIIDMNGEVVELPKQEPITTDELTAEFLPD